MEPLYIIKIGGNVINNPEKLQEFLHSAASIAGNKIIVHGGGKLVDELANKLGIKQQMIDGRRITDAQTLDVATMVYAGLINKKVVAQLQANGNNAVGLTGADNNCIQASKRINSTHDYGFVGDVIENGINTSFLSTLLKDKIVPVFCSITHDNQGQLFNTNADTMASILATGMAPFYDVKLIYCFEKKGVLQDVNDDNSAIPIIPLNEYDGLKKSGVVYQGMIPKLDNAFAAINQGVKSVVIVHADDLLACVNNNKNVGTTLIN